MLTQVISYKQILGLWQLTPTKQESRPEIQDVR